MRSDTDLVLAARSGENMLMMKLMEGFQKLFINDIAPLATLRNLGMTMMDGAEPVKAIMMRYALGTLGDRPELAKPVFPENRRLG